jgi:hypothetical protein
MPERLAALIRDNQPCVVLTGAGVSTEGGLPVSIQRGVACAARQPYSAGR